MKGLGVPERRLGGPAKLPAAERPLMPVPWDEAPEAGSVRPGEALKGCGRCLRASISEGV